MNEPLRAMLFVPGADERKLAKIPQLPASSFILDLEDAVAAEAKSWARELVAAALREHGEGGRSGCGAIGSRPPRGPRDDTSVSTEAGRLYAVHSTR